MIPNIGWFSILLEYYARVTFAKIKKKKSQESSNCYPLPISKAFNWANSIKGDRVIYWSYLGLSILSLCPQIPGCNCVSASSSLPLTQSWGPQGEKTVPFVQPLIHSFSKDLLDSYYMPDSALETREKAVNKT